MKKINKETLLKIVKSPKFYLAIIIFLYTIISFYKLGNTKNPQTFINLKNKENITFKIESDQIIEEIIVYSGAKESYISIFLSDEYPIIENYVYDGEIEIDYANLFKWNKKTINQEKNYYKYIMLQSYYDTTTIGEIRFLDKDGNEIKVTPMEEKGNKILDEQTTVPKDYSYLNSTYFDEVYFPRTAYELLHGSTIYEYTHPPLGKLLISIPVYFLGLTPFAYRLGGNICGILMLFIIYLIAKELFSKEKYAVFASLIFALDGMHFVQTRIGTVDSYLVLFCLTSFLFFLKYVKIPKDKTLKERVRPLLISGIFWGMAMSTKWTAAYVGLGMGLIYLVKFILDKKFDWKLLLLSVLSFIIIPITIYVCTYIPIILNPNHTLTYTYSYEKEEEKIKYFEQSMIEKEEVDNGTTTVTAKAKITNPKTFIDYQKIMYAYHSRLTEDHTYSSKWYEWPIMKRPLWFYIGRFENDQIGTIACMGNPAIWAIAILTSVLTTMYSIIKKDKNGLIIITMICATWLPYALIKRTMFIYHFFITLPFFILTIPYILDKLENKFRKTWISIPILTAIFLGFFIYFYPVYSGLPVQTKRIVKTEWQETWEYDGLIEEERKEIKENLK